MGFSLDLGKAGILGRGRKAKVKIKYLKSCFDFTVCFCNHGRSQPAFNIFLKSVIKTCNVMLCFRRVIQRLLMTLMKLKNFLEWT